MIKKVFTLLLFATMSITTLWGAETDASRVDADAAMKILIEGNHRYATDQTRHADHSKERIATAESQKPFAIIVGCSDSRVPPEIIFDQSLGDLFVIRVAGNVIGAIEAESIKYAALHLKSSLIVVLGHERCGAVKAVIDKQTEGVEEIAAIIQSSVNCKKEENDDQWIKAVKQNVLHMVDQLNARPSLAGLVKDGKVKIVGAVCDIDTGHIEWLQKP